MAKSRKEVNADYHTRAKIEKQYEKQRAEITRIMWEVDPTGDRYKSEALSQAQLLELYQKFAEEEIILKLALTFEDWLTLRDKARKDLFWLGTILGWKWYEHVHRATCDFFVKKNFDGVYHEGYTLDEVHDAIDRQGEIKHRLLLDPRHHYKTTIDSVDALQWLLNAPDARIFILTAEEDNALEFMLQIKGYMHQPRGIPMTDFQRLFPEYVVRGIDGSSKEDLVSPARRLVKQRDPSLWAESIMSTLSSQHCDIMKADDVISNRNSNNDEARKKLKAKFDQAIHLLSPKGFFDILGTRYATGDWYDQRMKASEDLFEAVGVTDLKVQVRAGLRIKDGVTPDGIAWEDLPLRQLKFEMVELLFPELKGTPEKTFQFFMSEIFNNETDFRCQILNQPAADAQQPFINPFKEELLTKSKEVNFASPTRDDGDIVIVWDTATTGNKQSDFCVGVVAQIWEQTENHFLLLIWQILSDKMSNTDLAINMVALSKKWNPAMTQFEMPRNLEVKDFVSILNHQKMAQEFYGPINSFIPDTQKDAKNNRIKGLEPLFRLELIKFMPGCQTDEAFKQFRGFTAGRVRGRKDDIPDTIGIIAKRMPFIGLRPNPEGVQLEKERKIREEAQRRLAMYNRIYGTDPNAPISTMHVNSPEEVEENPIYKALSSLSGESRAAFPRTPKS